MSSISAPYVDGELITNTSQISKKETTTSASNNSMDKEAFLQLLVAQMKYQDPLEPTSNTEYISQYATFSELEQMQNMSANMTLSRASEMVGKEVIVESTSDSGKITTVQGQVDSVTYQSNKAYISIEGTLYSVDDVVQIVDDEYQAGIEAIEAIDKELKKLPKIEQVTLNDATSILNIYNTYATMSDHQVEMLGEEKEKLIGEYVAKLNELLAAAEEAAKNEEGTTDAEGTGNTEGTTDTEGTADAEGTVDEGKTEDTEETVTE